MTDLQKQAFLPLGGFRLRDVGRLRNKIGAQILLFKIFVKQLIDGFFLEQKNNIYIPKDRWK